MVAAEQKARTTYDNILRLVKDEPDICEPIKFLRAREIVHFQRFGEANRTDLSKSSIQPYPFLINIFKITIPTLFFFKFFIRKKNKIYNCKIF